MSSCIFKIRAFKAMDDPKACEKYIEGHLRILRLFGLSMITSADPEWLADPDTYVIIVESGDGNKLYGGGRIQVASGKLSLPIETAIGDKEPSIRRIIEAYAENGTGEICGLWNSREMAVNGIGSLHLGRAIVAVAGQLSLNSLFALCAPATVRNCNLVGYETARFIGDNGRLYYPKDYLLATAMVINDLQNLPAASPGERRFIQELRNKPVQRKLEPGLKGSVLDMRYDLAIDNPIPAAYCLA